MGIFIHLSKFAGKTVRIKRNQNNINNLEPQAKEQIERLIQQAQNGDTNAMMKIYQDIGLMLLPVTVTIMHKKCFGIIVTAISVISGQKNNIYHKTEVNDMFLNLLKKKKILAV